MNTDKIVSAPVGHYRSDFVWRPFYAARFHTLNNPMLRRLPHLRRQFQILVVSFGELVWINLGNIPYRLVAPRSS